MPIVKQKTKSLSLYHTWSRKSTQYERVQRDLMICREMNRQTAGSGKQWSLKCTWNNMSELVWFSYKVIKVASALGWGGVVDFFFHAVIRKKTFYSSKIESTELHQKQYLEQGLRLFFGFHNAKHFFHPTKLVWDISPLKIVLYVHLADIWIIHHFLGGQKVLFSFGDRFY